MRKVLVHLAGRVPAVSWLLNTLYRLIHPRYLVGVSVIATDPRRPGLVLLHRSWESGKYSLPGGFLAPGDNSPEEAAERETLEETGYHIQIVGASHFFLKRGRSRTVLFLFRAFVIGESEEPTGFDTGGAVWVASAKTSTIHLRESFTLEFLERFHEEEIPWYQKGG